jgi:hypothetical protein
MAIDLGALLQGVAQGAPAGINTGIAVDEAARARKAQETQMTLLKMETATKYLKDPNVPESFKLKLWNSSVIPSLKSIYPEAEDIPALAAWTDSSTELSKGVNGILKGMRKGDYSLKDGLAMLVELKTSYSGAVDEANARVTPAIDYVNKELDRQAKEAKTGLAETVPQKTARTLLGVLLREQSKYQAVDEETAKTAQALGEIVGIPVVVSETKPTGIFAEFKKPVFKIAVDPKMAEGLVQELPPPGTPPTDSATPPASGTPITEEEAREYLEKAGGDKGKARELARRDGRTF